MASFTLDTPGTYLIVGQIDVLCIQQCTFYQMNTIINDVNSNKLATNMHLDLSGFLMMASSNFIRQVTHVMNYTLNTPTTYYLTTYLAAINNPIVLVRTKDSSTTVTTQNYAQTGTSITLTAGGNINVEKGMAVLFTGVQLPCYVLDYGGNMLTLSTSQTIPANTVISLSISNSATKLSVTRIA